MYVTPNLLTELTVAVGGLTRGIYFFVLYIYKVQ